MAKLTLTNITNISTSANEINLNSAATETAVENTLSRDGTSPNSMSAELDMDSNRILNLPDATEGQDPVTYNQWLAAGAGSGGAVTAAGVIYDQGGTGAVNRFLDGRLQERVSVKDFGAVGDGTTDDTAAITAAIAGISESETLYFPGGDYLVTTIIITKNISLQGGSTWSSATGSGASITSATASVPVLDFNSSATSHIRVSGIRINANSSSTACIRIDTANNGFQIDNVFLKGNNCTTGITVGAGSYLKLENIYTTGFSDANITNTGLSRLLINGGLHDVGTNAFIYVNGLNGGNLLVKDTYLEWASGTRDIIKLNNTSSPTDIVLDNIYQSSATPQALIHNVKTGMAAPTFKLENYRGTAPTNLYEDDDAAGRNIAWSSNAHKGVVLYHEITTEIPASVPAFTTLDTTPSVAAGKVFRTNNGGATTISDFDDGFDGKEIKVLILDANTTIDFTGSSLLGNGGGDWSPSNGDHMDCTYYNTKWYCEISDNTA